MVSGSRFLNPSRIQNDSRRASHPTAPPQRCPAPILPALTESMLNQDSHDSNRLGSSQDNPGGNPPPNRNSPREAPPPQSGDDNLFAGGRYSRKSWGNPTHLHSKYPVGTDPPDHFPDGRGSWDPRSGKNAPRSHLLRPLPCHRPLGPSPQNPCHRGRHPGKKDRRCGHSRNRTQFLKYPRPAVGNSAPRPKNNRPQDKLSSYSCHFPFFIRNSIVVKKAFKDRYSRYRAPPISPFFVKT